MKWGKPESEYRKKFAWLPVKIEYRWIWLEYYDTTGWYYDPEKCTHDLIKSRRYPSKM